MSRSLDGQKGGVLKQKGRRNKNRNANSKKVEIVKSLFFGLREAMGEGMHGGTRKTLDSKSGGREKEKMPFHESNKTLKTTGHMGGVSMKRRAKLQKMKYNRN